MSRSIWKPPFSLLKVGHRKKVGSVFVWSRNSMILPQHVGKSVQIYNGKNWTRRTIVEDMVAHKFGEFSYTKRKTIHKINKIKKINKVKKVARNN